MTTRSTLGWSLVSSGIVTIVLSLLPGPDIAWGIALLVAGISVMALR